MAFNTTFEDADAQLQQALSAEREDVRQTSEQVSEVTIETLGRTQQALKTYAVEAEKINETAGIAVSNLVESVNRYNELRSAPFHEKILNKFQSFTDPSKDIGKASNDIKLNQQKLKLTELQRRQAQERLNTATSVQQATLDIESTKLDQELREYNLIKEQIQTQRQAETEFLTTRSPQELTKAQQSGMLTRQQVSEELSRRERLLMSNEQLDMSVQMQRQNLFEYNRKQILQNSVKHQVQAMYDESLKPERGGIFREGNVFFTSTELKKRLDEFAQAEVTSVGDAIATSEGLSVGRSTVEKLARYTGMDISDMSTADAFDIISKRADVFTTQEQTLIRQANVLQNQIDSIEDGQTRAELSKAYLKISETLQQSLDQKLKTEFPAKEVQVALDQHLQNGVISDKVGAQQLLFQMANSGQSTGSAMYDDILLTYRPVAQQMADQPILTEVEGFQENLKQAANKATSFAYNHGIFQTVRQIATNPVLADLRLDVALANPGSAIYDERGKLSLDSLMNYFDEAFGDNAVPQWAKFKSKLFEALPQYARQTFGFTGATPRGAVSISAINNQVFGNQPIENFIASTRSQITRKEQRRWARLAPGNPTNY